MVSINTNLSSLIVQNNLTKSTSALNTAIERMTTGFKINGAKDNAAGYSIAETLSSKLSSYEVAQDNIAAGMDLLATAQDTISLMQTNAERLQALCVQARNGTYGATSLAAMNSEASSILSSLLMAYSNTEYNGINLFDRVSYIVADGLPQKGESGFIDESEETGVTEPVGTTGDVGTSGVVGLTSSIAPSYNGFIADPTARDGEGDPIDVDSLTSVAGLTDFSSADSFKITSKSDLEHFRDLVNAGKDTTGKSFYLTADIDLGEVAENVTNWTPIGYYTSSSNHKEFKGTFDGNGHKITNLSINNESTDYQALFGGQVGAGATIKNLGVEGRVKGKQATGGLVAYLNSSAEKQSVIENCYSDVKVTGTSFSGGLVGYAYDNSSISNSYATGQVTVSGEYAGGLAGGVRSGSSITNSFATGAVTGTGERTGGLVGSAGTNSNITNSYATGIVTGTTKVGGLAGSASGLVTNCYAIGDVIWSESGTGERFGGLVGTTGQGAEIKDSFSSGTVSANMNTGGLVGYVDSSESSITKISNSYATGNVTGASYYTGGLVGYANTSSSVSNSYASGQVTGARDSTGGLVGYANTSSSISNSYATGQVTGTDEYTGGLVGQAYGSVNNSYATGQVTGTHNTGGLVGWIQQRSISNSYATGVVTGTTNTGGLVGYSHASVINSYATGQVTGNDSTGGLVGKADSYCSTSNSYATGNVTGTTNVGGFVGNISGGTFSTCYSGGKVNGTEFVGGFIGQVGDSNISNSVSYSKVLSGDKAGSFIGGITTGNTLRLSNCTSANLTDMDMISGKYTYSAGVYTRDDSYNMTSLLNQISEYELLPSDVTLQIGINGDSSSQVTFDSNFSYDLSSITNKGIQSDEALNAVNSFLNMLSAKSTELGAVSNRLESALESTAVSIENLTSSRSTIKDADIAKVSSEYIKHQILQQASATLLATANQSPAIALQLI